MADNNTNNLEISTPSQNDLVSARSQSQTSLGVPNQNLPPNSMTKRDPVTKDLYITTTVSPSLTTPSSGAVSSLPGTASTSSTVPTTTSSVTVDELWRQTDHLISSMDDGGAFTPRKVTPGAPRTMNMLRDRSDSINKSPRSTVKTLVSSSMTTAATTASPVQSTDEINVSRSHLERTAEVPPHIMARMQSAPAWSVTTPRESTYGGPKLADRIAESGNELDVHASHVTTNTEPGMESAVLSEEGIHEKLPSGGHGLPSKAPFKTGYIAASSHLGPSDDHSGKLVPPSESRGTSMPELGAAQDDQQPNIVMGAPIGKGERKDKKSRFKIGGFLGKKGKGEKGDDDSDDEEQGHSGGGIKGFPKFGKMVSALRKSPTEASQQGGGSSSRTSSLLSPFIKPGSSPRRHSGSPDNAATDETKKSPSPTTVGCISCAYLRIFREDASFTTVSCSPEIIVSELISLAAKKFFLDNAAAFKLFISRNGQERLLKPGEMPVQIQNSLFEGMGYKCDEDHVERMGRYDTAFLCKFILKEVSTVQVIGHALNLRGLNLIEFPSYLWQDPSDIEKLDLSMNLNIQQISPSISEKLRCLRHLVMTFCELTDVPKAIAQLTSLTTLDLSNNRIKDLEESGISELEALEILNLANNAFKDFSDRGLPWNFGDLESLIELDIRGNCLGESSSGEESVVLGVLSRCSALEIIRADGNRIRWMGRWRDRGIRRRRESGRNSAQMLNQTDADIAQANLVEHDAASDIDAGDDVDGEGPVGPSRSLEFSKLKTLSLMMQTASLNTRPFVFRLSNLGASLCELNLSSCGLEQLPHRFFQRIQGVEILNLSGNHLHHLPPFTFLKSDMLSMFGSQSNLKENREGDFLSTVKSGVLYLRQLIVSGNFLDDLPTEIGDLQNLEVLDVHHNNLLALPLTIWSCSKLKYINASSNKLTVFPDPDGEEDGHDESSARSTLSPNPGSPITSPKNRMSVISQNTLHRRRTRKRQTEMLSIAPSYGSTSCDLGQYPGSASMLNLPNSEKTDTIQQQQNLLPPLSLSLERLSLADNRITEEIYVPLYYLPQLVYLNLSNNDITPMLVSNPIPTLTGPWFTNLRELYLSGNSISSLPSEIEKMRKLESLFLNANRLNTIPGELAKIGKLAILDFGCQLGGKGEGSALHYNVTNWPYDWNWNWNLGLRYLNLSGNRRLEIKPSLSHAGPSGKDLADFSALFDLRILGLNDVTCLVNTPQEAVTRRVRTFSTDIQMPCFQGGLIRYGFADTIGTMSPSIFGFEKHEDPISPVSINLPTPEVITPATTANQPKAEDDISIWDVVIPTFRGRENESVFALIDGRGTKPGNKIARHLFERLGKLLQVELEAAEKLQAEYQRDLKSKQSSSEFRVSVVDAETGEKKDLNTSQGNLTASTQPVDVENTNEAIILDIDAVKNVLRRVFLEVNREVGSLYNSWSDQEKDKVIKESPNIPTPTTGPSSPQKQEMYGCSCVLVYLRGSAKGVKPPRCSIFVANVGDSLAVLSKAGGVAETLTRNFSVGCETVANARYVIETALKRRQTVRHEDDNKLQIVEATSPTASLDALSADAAYCPRDPEPWHFNEIRRIKSLGGWISSEGLINDKVDLCRGFGYIPCLGTINSDPFIHYLELNVAGHEEVIKHKPLAHSVNRPKETVTSTDDEFIVLTSGEVWKSLGSGQYEDGSVAAVQIARSVANVAGGGGASSTSAITSPETSRRNVSSMTPSMIFIPSHDGQNPAMKASATGGWMTAAMKVRDVAIGRSCEAGTRKPAMAVMVLGLRDLAKKSTWWGRASNDPFSEQNMQVAKKAIDRLKKIGKLEETKMSPMKEMKPPTGQVVLVFTDIRNSTVLWENYPVDMRNAIKLHNVMMRKRLKDCGGYEVKTEGDAFMVSFQDVLHAIEWCLTVQLELRHLNWPKGILDCPDCADTWWVKKGEAEGEFSHDAGSLPDIKSGACLLLFRGLSIRMGVHIGSPLCEVCINFPTINIELISASFNEQKVDPTTGRMDYYGPVVNRAARVSQISQGGQILISGDVMKEIKLRIFSRLAHKGDNGLSDAGLDAAAINIVSGQDILENIDSEEGIVRRLKAMGLIAWDFGEIKLKGLETPENIYMISPKELKERHAYFENQKRNQGKEKSSPIKAIATKAVPIPSSSSKDEIAKSEVERLASLCHRLEILAARSGDEWQEKLGTGGMWQNLESQSPASPRPHSLPSSSGFNRNSGLMAAITGVASESANLLSIPASRTSLLPSSKWLANPASQEEDEWGLSDVLENDNDQLMAILTDIAPRIEKAISIIYLTKPSPFTKVLRSLGEALDDDPNEVMLALQLYAQQLAERRERRLRDRGVDSEGPKSTK
ncbi:cysteinyl-tRNA synthetase [Blyttiomyces sp. JEL0837]|nr:cysteinyl-tRNA synthetase [Blyttiomyces sp. JEL0837]